jgi:hypothetical protein
MAHSSLHFALGAVIGSAAAARPLLRAWRDRLPLAPPYRRWLLVSYGLALWAIMPALLRWLGVPDHFCGAWGMNVFLFHPALTRLKDGGAIVGTVALLALGTAHYTIVLLGLRECRRRLGGHEAGDR